MLLNTLYSINELKIIENATILAEVSINEAHEVFNGHFPGKPVMPGVCLMNMLSDLLSETKQIPYYIRSADYVKFIHLVDPLVNKTLSIRIVMLSDEDRTIRVEATVFYENTIFLKYKGFFGSTIA